MTAPILIYGATGYTGGLIARELRGRGRQIVLAGRDPHRLEALGAAVGADEVRAAEVHDDVGLAAAMKGMAVVVSCAGPFLRVGEPVVRAALAAGVHYLDTTGEQAFVRDIYERYESAARRAGVVVCNSCAYEVALGDWAGSLAADLMGRDEPLDEVTVSYAFDSVHTSRGTQLSAIESISAPASVWRDDRWDPVAPAAEARDVHFPEPFGVRQAVSFPSPEVITLPRHIDCRRAQTYISLLGNSPGARLATQVASLIGPALPLLARSPLAAFARAQAIGSATETNRGDARFAIVAEAVRDFRRGRVTLHGRDVYGVTADIIATAATTLADETPRAVGILAPSQILDPRVSLCDLAERRGLVMEESAP